MCIVDSRLGLSGDQGIAGIRVLGGLADKQKLIQKLALFYLSISTRHYHVLNACSQQKENVRILLHENNKLLVEQAEPQAYFGEEKRFCEEASKTIDFPCAKEQQVG